MKDRLIYLTKIAVTAAMVYWIIRSVDWENALLQLSLVSPSIIVLSILTMLAGWLISSLKWRELLHIHDRIYAYWQLTRWYGISYFLSQFMPTDIGGDVYRVYKTFGDRGDQRAAAMLAVFVERFTGFFALAVLGVLASVHLWVVSKDVLSGYVLAIAAPAAALGGIALFITYRFNLATRIVNSRWCPKVVAYLLQGAGAYKYHPSRTLYVLFLSFLFHGLRILVFAMLTAVLSGKWMALEIALVLTLTLVIGLLPISLGGYGVVDGAFMYLMSIYGLDMATGIVVMLLVRLTALPISVIGGMLYVIDGKTKIAKGAPH